MDPLMTDGTHVREVHPEAVEEATRDHWRLVTDEEVEAQQAAKQVTCHECDGEGQVIVRVGRFVYGGYEMEEDWRVCPVCDGERTVEVDDA